MDFNIYNLDTKIMLTAILSLSFVTLLLIILHIYIRCIITRHQRAATATTINPPPPHISDPIHPNSGLDQAIIDSLPCFKFNQKYVHDELDCAVCLSGLEEGELTRTLPNCDHYFHVACIDRWLTNQSTCPICRSEVTPRLAPLHREPPMHGVGMVVTSEDDHYIDGFSHNNDNVISTKIDTRGSGRPSSSSSSSSLPTSSSFRLSSFRRMLDRNRSSSSSRFQVYGQLLLDLERQG